MKKTIIPCVNYHITNRCNMKCKYCFAHYEKESCGRELSLKDKKRIIKQIACYRFKKISFAGGEPTLLKDMPELVKYAKRLGLVTMVVSNGSGIKNSSISKMNNSLDWISISIDSLKEEINSRIGRIIGRTGATEECYRKIVETCKKWNIKLKLNTVVSSVNHREDFKEFIKWASPNRWKIFQVLPISGQNDSVFEKYEVSRMQFEEFTRRHAGLSKSVNIAIEDNSDMKGSYVMIDPYGRFYNNKSGKHEYSLPILKEGIDKAFRSMNYSDIKFRRRGGIYDMD